MIPRWRPLPTTAGLDARLRCASHGARGVFLLLACAADTSGTVLASGSMLSEETVDAIAGDALRDAVHWEKVPGALRSDVVARAETGLRVRALACSYGVVLEEERDS